MTESTAPSTRPEADTVWMGALPPIAEGGLSRPRIGIAGISIESSTFSPHVSGDEAFTIREGAELIGYYPFLDAGRDLREAAEWVPIHHGRSLPGGAVAPPTYRRMKDAIVHGIRAEIAAGGAFDGFFFDIHGAMSVVGMDDAEGDLAAAVRAELGDDVLVSTSMDLHGNVSEVLRERAGPAHLLPDGSARGLDEHQGARGVEPARAAPRPARIRSAVRRRRTRHGSRCPCCCPVRRPAPGWSPPRGSTPRCRTSRRSTASWTPRSGSATPGPTSRATGRSSMVTGDDRALIAREAERLARRYWDARADFVFVGPTARLGEALDRALAPGAARPYVISDSGDNGRGREGQVLVRLGDRGRQRADAVT